MMGKKVYDIGRNVACDCGNDLVDCEIYIKELSDIIKVANINLKEFNFKNAKSNLELAVELIEKNKKNKCGE